MDYSEKFNEFLKEETHKEMFNKNHIITKDDLIEWCCVLQVDKLECYSKAKIMKVLLDKEIVNYLDFYNRFNYKMYGIHPSRFSNKFNVNNYQRHKMQEQGFINTLYIKEEEIYPARFEKVHYYNPVQYFDLTQENIEEWKSVNIKGYVNKNQCSFFDEGK